MVQTSSVTISPGTPLTENPTLAFATSLEDTTEDGTALIGTLYINEIPHHLEFLTLEEYTNRGYITHNDVPPEKFQTVRVGKGKFIAVLTPFERR